MKKVVLTVTLLLFWALVLSACGKEASNAIDTSKMTDTVKTIATNGGDTCSRSIDWSCLRG